MKDIFKFWLVDHNVDGFRLDAVTSYFTGDQDKNLAFMTWLNSECRKLKPNCYIVGEGNWASNSAENLAYQESGIDSFFQFANSAKNNGYISRTVTAQMATYISSALTNNAKNVININKKINDIREENLKNNDVQKINEKISNEKEIIVKKEIVENKYINGNNEMIIEDPDEFIKKDKMSNPSVDNNLSISLKKEKSNKGIDNKNINEIQENSINEYSISNKITLTQNINNDKSKSNNKIFFNIKNI